MDSTPLEHIPLFATLTKADLERVAQSLTRHEYSSGNLLCREGDEGDRMFILLSGQVEVLQAYETEDQRLLNTLGAGAYIGEMSLLERGGHRTATVRTITPVKVLEITRSAFDDMLARWPSMTIDMLRELSLRLRDTERATIRDLQEKNRELAQAYQELKEAHAQIIVKERLERELQVATQIQMSMLPSTMPVLQGFDFGAKILPARAVGGDLYDFVTLNPDTLGILVGDVSDKGVPAALFMALTRSLLRAEASMGLPPDEVLSQVNRHLLDMNTAGMFVSMLYGILCRETREFVFARAGHEIPKIVTEAGELIEVPHGSGQLIGLFPNPALDEQTVIIPEGGSLLLYTDGTSDAMNVNNEFFESERLDSALIDNREQDAQGICDNLMKAILDFQGDASQMDDITLLAIKSVR